MCVHMCVYGCAEPGGGGKAAGVQGTGYREPGGGGKAAAQSWWAPDANHSAQGSGDGEVGGSVLAGLK